MLETLNRISHDIIGSAFRIHSALGPGLFESAYHAVLVRDLRRKNYFVESQKPVPIVFEGVSIKKAFYADIVVAGQVLVEVKSVKDTTAVFTKQVITYLKLLDLRLGLLLNFGTPSLTIKRIVNQL